MRGEHFFKINTAMREKEAEYCSTGGYSHRATFRDDLMCVGVVKVKETTIFLRLQMNVIHS